jgi:hypothetical protein
MLQANRELIQECIIKNPVARGKWFVACNCRHGDYCFEYLILSACYVLKHIAILTSKNPV